MRVTRQSIFPASADVVWETLQRPETLEYITRGMIAIDPVDIPDPIQEGSVARMRVKILNLPPPMDYEIRLERIDPVARELLTNEHGGMIKSWIHRITVEPLSAGRCVYTDQIDIDAGPMTVVVWAYAQVFYRVRQRRWLDLLAAI
jgi:ligand-binding SRPBCC domain-containing protein